MARASPRSPPTVSLRSVSAATSSHSACRPSIFPATAARRSRAFYMKWRRTWRRHSRRATSPGVPESRRGRSGASCATASANRPCAIISRSVSRRRATHYSTATSRSRASPLPAASPVRRVSRAASAPISASRRAPIDRGALMFKLAYAIAEQRDELARLETLDVGKPLRDSLSDVDGVVNTLRYNAGAADKMQGETIPLGPDVVDFTLLEPMGVTAHIVPWNFPLGMAMRSMAPALAAGCTVVLKPAEQSPPSALKFAELLPRAGLPRGVVNVVNGFGEDAGETLVRHPLVRGHCFTGSPQTCTKI